MAGGPLSGKVRFVGQLARADAVRLIADARLVVLPSQCFEGLPTVMIEAFAFGTPVAVSRIGPLPSFVREGTNGTVFEPGDPGSLLAAVRAIWQSPAALERLGVGARKTFETTYAEDANHAALMGIYETAIELGRTRRRGEEVKRERAA